MADLPIDEFIKDMDKKIGEGFDVFVKFTCQHCKARQTCSTPNAMFTEGYTCEECGKTSYPKEYGMMLQARMGSTDTKNPLDWEGTNLQSYAIIPPKEDEREMVLELFCIGCQAHRLFTVTTALGDFFVRKTKFVEYGCACHFCGKKLKVKLEWSKIPSWKHFKKDEKGEIVPK